MPIFRSPKSTEFGVVTTAFDALGEKDLESDPQPVRPAASNAQQAKKAKAPDLRSKAGAIFCALAL